MVILQWAALPEDRQHATIRALYEGTIRLCMSQAALDEVRDVLNRPGIVARSPNLTLTRIDDVLGAVVHLSQWFQSIPNAFSLPQHPDDDHLLNLAIESKAKYLVTWETRLLELTSGQSPEAEQLRALAPELRVIDPPTLAKELRLAREMEQTRQHGSDVGDCGDEP